MFSSVSPIPRATILISPREQFSQARASLESILAHRDEPVDIVYVDAGSPPKLRDWLARKAREHDFTLLRTDLCLSPNKARNLGLAQVRTPYVAFVDNDVLVTPGWLEKLVECAQSTGADVVSPLVCEGDPRAQIVHCAGGETGVKTEVRKGVVSRRFIEKIHHQGHPVSEVRPQLRRQPTGLAEFHCMLVRTSVFERIGPLDEGQLNTKEHCDLCLQVERTGGRVWLEPDSLVTYDYRGRRLSDLPFFMLRWSDQWELDSLENLRRKYELTADDEYYKTRVNKRGWRRRHKIWRPLVTRLCLGRRVRWLEDLLVRIDCLYNRRLTDHYAREVRTLRPQVVHRPVGVVSPVRQAA
ncbi:MAG: glycosyltransferase [Pirellulaceae bacterium]|nr:glycosyltransferase [Pirellulaceae bacterium]